MKFWVRLVFAIALSVTATAPLVVYAADRILVAQAGLDDATAWALVRDTADPAVLERFIAQFPNSPYVDEAQAKIDALNAIGGDIEVPQTPPPQPPPEPSSSSSSVTPPTEINPAELTFLVQGQLIRVGCSAGPADGKWGPQSVRAVNDFYDNAHLGGSTEPTEDLLTQLKVYPGRVCPLSCPAGKVVKGDQCVTKTCPTGQKLSSKGACYTPPAPGGGGGNPPPPPHCFVFNGQNFCE